MNRLTFNLSLLFRLLAVVAVLVACGGQEAEPAATSPAEEPAEVPIDPLEEALAAIDSQLRETLSGSIAHSAPATMLLDETTTITLLLSPSLAPEELAAEVSDDGPVIADVIQVTPWMQAELRSLDQDAFLVSPLHSDDRQPLSTIEPTEWRWLVEAKEEGLQRLIVSVSRLVEVEGRESWRLVETYRHTIDVQITLGTRLINVLGGLWDFKFWIGGLLLPIVVAWILRRLDFL